MDAVVREKLYYESDTGIVGWRVPPRRGTSAGPAGSPDRSGHLYLKIAGKRLPLHRIAWFLHHGQWPAERIDHINGNPADNRVANLRLASHAENIRNSAKWRTRPGRLKGTVFISGNSRRPWLARITVNGHARQLGYYATEAEAGRAYDAAAKELFGEFSRPNFPEYSHAR